MDTYKITEVVEVDTPEWAGYEIKTRDHTISFLIENSRHCCETWGVEIGWKGKIYGWQKSQGAKFDEIIHTPAERSVDKLSVLPLVGKSVEKTQWYKLNKHPQLEDEDQDDRVRCYASVVVDTGSGKAITLTAWNESSGYTSYLHTIKVKWFDYEKDTYYEDEQEL